MRGKHHPFFVAFLMLSVYFLCASVQPAMAKLYKWKDDKGSTHYTDNENNIPLKYRTKDRIEKLRGLVRPKPPEEETPAEETDGEGEDEAPEPEDEVSEEGGLSEVDAEALAFMEEVKIFLALEIKLHKQILNSVKPDVKNGKHLILPVKARARLKFAMADRIKKSGIASLKPVSQYLIISADLDSKGELGGDNYLGRILEWKERLEDELITKEKLIKKLADEIAQAK